jgi:preprotein translocase subunit SecF
MNHSRVINFTKHRYLFLIISALVIVGGVAGMVLSGGFNLGIDFQAGLSQRVQIADAALAVAYEGSDDVTLDVVNRNLVLEFRNQDGVRRTVLRSADYATIDALASALEAEEGVEVTVYNGSAPSSQIVTGLNLPYTLSREPALINTANTDGSAYISIDEIREAVSGVAGSPQVQIVGDAALQEFQIRAEASAEGEKEELESQILEMLQASFGEDSVVTKQSDYVGPKFSNLLTYRSIIMVAVALALIMAYIWIRFQFASAFSAVTALAHDILVMLGVIAVFRLEVTTTTIAAVLTIIGYSLNDTIVVFDRIRENTGLLKGKTFERIVNTSITQSLSRTLITSLTTLLAVIPLFIFASGAIRLFALNLIVGIIVGTYSSIFIASPVLLAVTNRQIQRKARHLGKDPSVVLAEQAEKETPKAVQQTQQEIEIPTAQRKLRGKRKS